MRLMQPVVLAACLDNDARFLLAAGGKYDHAASTAAPLLKCCAHLNKMPLAQSTSPNRAVLSGPGAVLQLSSVIVVPKLLLGCFPAWADVCAVRVALFSLWQSAGMGCTRLHLLRRCHASPAQLHNTCSQHLHDFRAASRKDLCCTVSHEPAGPAVQQDAWPITGAWSSTCAWQPCKS